MAKGRKIAKSDNSSDVDPTPTNYSVDDNYHPKQTVPRTPKGSFKADKASLKEDDQSGASSPSNSSRNWHEEDHDDDHWSAGTESATGSKATKGSAASNSSKKKRRQKNKKSERKEEAEKDPQRSTTDEFLLSMHQDIITMMGKLNSLTDMVVKHDQILSHSEKPVSEPEGNKFFSQLARATEEVDWRDIIQPKLLHVNDLSTDNNAVDRHSNDGSCVDVDVNNAHVNIPADNFNQNRFAQKLNPSAKHSPTSRTTSARADSYISKVYNDLDRSTKAAKQNQVVIMRQEKECKVKINKLELGSVASAIRGILEFQEQEGTPVNMMKVLSPSVREYLRTKYRASPEDFREWSVTDLFKVMARETVVTNAISFYEQLKAAMQHKTVMPWSSVTPLNHETFFLHQIRFIDEFKTILKLMLENNANCCPQVDTKKYGLLYLFRELNNPDYFDEVYNGLLKRARYDNMFKFFDEYRKAIGNHYQLSLLVKDVPYSAHKQSKSKREETYHQEKRRITKQLNSTSGNKYSGRGSNSRFQDHRELNHITSTHDEDEVDDEDHDVWRNTGPEGQSEDYQDEDSVSVASNETESEDEDQKDSKADDDFNQQLAAMENEYRHKATGSSNAKKSYACLKKILSGNCDRPNCPYDHRPEKLKEAAKDVETKANAFLKSQANKPSNTSKPTLMVRDKGKFNSH